MLLKHLLFHQPSMCHQYCIGYSQLFFGNNIFKNILQSQKAEIRLQFFFFFYKFSKHLVTFTSLPFQFSIFDCFYMFQLVSRNSSEILFGKFVIKSFTNFLFISVKCYGLHNTFIDVTQLYCPNYVTSLNFTINYYYLLSFFLNFFFGFVFCFIWVFFHEHSRLTVLQGKWQGISVTLLYHFHQLHRHSDFKWEITAES